MGKKITQSEFDERINKLVGDEYTFLDLYQGTDTKIRCRHNKCGNTWKIKPSNFYHGYRCPKCSHGKAGLRRRYNTEWYKDQVNNLVGNEYSVLGDYVKSSVKIKMRHNKCGYIWNITPNNFLKGRRCPQCNKIKNSKRLAKMDRERGLNNQQAIQNIKEMSSLVQKIKIIGPYKGFHKPFKLQCKHCGLVWSPRYDDIIYNKTSCPACSIEPKGEMFVREYLNKNAIFYERQKTFKGLILHQHLSYDFYIPNNRILIEYQGGQHYFPVKWLGGVKRFRNQHKRDVMKYNYAQDHNYKLIYIPYLCDSKEKVFNFLNMCNLKGD